MRHRTRAKALFVTTLTTVFVFSFAAKAFAAPADRTITQPLSGTAAPITLFDTGLQVCDDCVPDFLVSNFDQAGAGAQLSSTIGTKWTSDAQTKVSYDDSLLRQGSTLPTSDAFKSSNGSITATFNLDAFIGLVVRNNGDPVWHKTTTSISPHLSHDVVIPCELPPVGGPANVCDSGSLSFTVATFPVLPGLVSIDLNLSFDLQVTVDADGVTTVRKASVASGSAITPDHSFTFSPTTDTQSDSMLIACGQPAGNDLNYSLTDMGIHSSVAYALNFGIDIVADITALPDFTLHIPVASAPIGHTSVTLTAADGTADLGPVLPDLDPPTADPGGGSTHTYPGVEGSAVAFDGSASSDPHCGPPDLTWNFGDGSATATGTSPSHVYSEEGTYHGTLTATNGAGLTSSTPFTVTVDDAPLIANGHTIVAANPVSATVADFTDTDPTNTLGDPAQDPSDYTATIAWGDGGSSAGTIVPNGTGFDVTGTHTYSGANLGPQTLHIHICDVGGACADATSNLTVFEFLGHGGFVIGDGAAASAAHVTFWGAQWVPNNPVSGGPAPASFKGFADTTSTTPPACGGTFSAGPGNSANYAGALPSYMGVLVADSVAKHGNAIGGHIAHIVVVHTDAGYSNNPGHAGTGTEVTVFC
jgi:PKD repeat protein